MTEITPSSRFQVVPSPVRNPGSCFICRSAGNAPFVDTGLSHLWYNEAPDPSRDGVVYICVACVTEMAHNLNLVDADISQLVHGAYLDGRRDGFAEGELMVREFASNFVDSGRSFTNPVSDGSIGDSISDPSPVEDEQGQQRLTEKSDNVVGSVDSNGSDKRPVSVPGDSADGELHATDLDEFFTK